MVDGGVLGFAGWTLLTNAFVLAGGGLDALVATSLSAGVGLLLVTSLWGIRRSASQG